MKHDVWPKDAERLRVSLSISSGMPLPRINHITAVTPGLKVDLEDSVEALNEA
jgi:hypothetical protein